MPSLRQKAIWSTVIAAFFWSTGGLFIKLLPQSAFVILFYRSLFAGLLFLFIFRTNLIKINKATILPALFYAPLLIFFVLATKLTTAANAIFLQYLAPAFVLILEPILFKLKLTKINIWTVIICFFGMTLFFIDQLDRPESWYGILYALISAFMLAGLILSQKANMPDRQVTSIFIGNILVCLYTLPDAMIAQIPSTLEMSYLMILGICQIGFGYLFFVYGQRHLPATESAFIAMLEPILNPIWVIIGYGEFPGKFATIGGVIILITLVFRMWLIDRYKSRSLQNI